MDRRNMISQKFITESSGDEFEFWSTQFFQQAFQSYAEWLLVESGIGASIAYYDGRQH